MFGYTAPQPLLSREVPYEELSFLEKCCFVFGRLFELAFYFAIAATGAFLFWIL